jgi:hypothetical protein
MVKDRRLELIMVGADDIEILRTTSLMMMMKSVSHDMVRKLV